MPSLTGGLKLDTLVYNLEYLQLEYLFGDMIQDRRPVPGTVLLMGNAMFNFPPEVDGRTYRMTPDPTHAVPYFIAIGDVTRHQLQSHMQRDGDLFHYMAFANAGNEQLQALLKDYPLVTTKRYQRHGYTFDLYTFRFTFAP
jgi:hypothetical protein